MEFSVDLIRGQASGAPRAENDEYLMSSGIGNSLTDALQLATTQLVNWLQREYTLEPNEAAVVLGMAMRYDVAEVVDPLVHVVAKIRKDAIARLSDGNRAARRITASSFAPRGIQRSELRGPSPVGLRLVVRQCETIGLPTDARGP